MTSQLAMDTSRIDRKYTIDHPLEIMAIMRSLKARKALVAAYLGSGDEFFLTSLLAIEPAGHGIVLGNSMQRELNERILAVPRILCVAAQNGIKITFELQRLQRILFDGYEALAAQMPPRLKRWQRRECYRVVTPTANPLKCSIPLPTGGDVATAELIVLDLSISGVGLIDHHHLVELAVGNRYSDCRIALPGWGNVHFDAEVIGNLEVTLPNGMSCRRSGCEFVELSQADEGALQRYVLQLERERNALLTH